MNLLIPKLSSFSPQALTSPSSLSSWTSTPQVKTTALAGTRVYFSLLSKSFFHSTSSPLLSSQDSPREVFTKVLSISGSSLLFRKFVTISFSFTQGEYSSLSQKPATPLNSASAIHLPFLTAFHL